MRSMSLFTNGSQARSRIRVVIHFGLVNILGEKALKLLRYGCLEAYFLFGDGVNKL